MRKVAIYGKGGIGKSTTTQNTVAAFLVGRGGVGKRAIDLRLDPLWFVDDRHHVGRVLDPDGRIAVGLHGAGIDESSRIHASS